jgi:hypothetical protein
LLVEQLLVLLTQVLVAQELVLQALVLLMVNVHLVYNIFLVVVVVVNLVQFH